MRRDRRVPQTSRSLPSDSAQEPQGGGDLCHPHGFSRSRPASFSDCVLHPLRPRPGRLLRQNRAASIASMASHAEQLIPVNSESLDLNTWCDRIFHSATYLFALAGLFLFWRSARLRISSGRTTHARNVAARLRRFGTAVATYPAWSLWLLDFAPTLDDLLRIRCVGV